MCARSQTSGDWSGECCVTTSSSESGSSSLSVRSRAAASSAAIRSFSPTASSTDASLGTHHSPPGAEPVRFRGLRQVLLVCPQERDLREIRAAGLASDFDVLTAGTDLDDHDDAFDAARFVLEQSGRPVDGVVGTKDRSALLAALIAERAG